MNKLFYIYFEDGTNFEGGTNYFESKWKDIPNKKIKSLSYRLPCGTYLNFSNYDKYYHIVEGTKDLNGINKGKTIIRSIKLLAKIGDKITIYKILNDKVEKEIVDNKNEFIKKLNPIFWR